MSILELAAFELMSPQVVTVGPDETLRRAAELLCDNRLHCLVVPPEDPRRAYGVIATKDIVQVLCQAEPEVLSELRVRDAMTTPAITVQREMLILDCLRLMRLSGVRSAPVLDRHELVGILSFTDVLRAIASQGR